MNMFLLGKFFKVYLQRKLNLRKTFEQLKKSLGKLRYTGTCVI